MRSTGELVIAAMIYIRFIDQINSAQRAAAISRERVHTSLQRPPAPQHVTNLDHHFTGCKIKSHRNIFGDYFDQKFHRGTYYTMVLLRIIGGLVDAFTFGKYIRGSAIASKSVEDAKVFKESLTKMLEIIGIVCGLLAATAVSFMHSTLQPAGCTPGIDSDCSISTGDSNWKVQAYGSLALLAAFGALCGVLMVAIIITFTTFTPDLKLTQFCSRYLGSRVVGSTFFLLGASSICTVLCSWAMMEVTYGRFYPVMVVVRTCVAIAFLNGFIWTIGLIILAIF